MLSEMCKKPFPGGQIRLNFRESEDGPTHHHGEGSPCCNKGASHTDLIDEQQDHNDDVDDIDHQGGRPGARFALSAGAACDGSGERDGKASRGIDEQSANGELSRQQ